MKANHVYLYEEKGGGIQDPTLKLTGEMKDLIEVEEFPLKKDSSSNPVYFFRKGREVSMDCDVVHIHFDYGIFGNLYGYFDGIMFLAFAAGIDKPIVTSFHNFIDFEPEFESLTLEGLKEFVIPSIRKQINNSLIRNTDFFIPFTKEEERTLENYVPSKRIERIPLVSETNAKHMDKEECKEELGFEDRKIITSFGWIRRSKGYDRVIRVLAELPEEVVYIIAGSLQSERHEEYLEELKELASERGVRDRVVFTGHYPEEKVPLLFNATDVMALPYTDNRASDVLARGLAYHIPVIASNQEEFRIVKDRWGCPKIFEDEDGLEELLEAVLLEDDKEELVKNSKRYSENMNWKSVSERIVEIYGGLIEDGN